MTDSPEPEPRRRPLIERIGLAVIAAAMAVMFGAVAALSSIGCLMTVWVGVVTTVRG